MAKILVVEDAYLTSQLIYFILQKYSHTIEYAANGEEAMEQLAQTPFDLVLTDLTMPVMDGFTLLEKIRSDERYQDLPVIVITASGVDWVEALAFEKGATAFLTQPFSTEQLRKLVQDCLEPSDSANRINQQC